MPSLIVARKIRAIAAKRQQAIERYNTQMEKALAMCSHRYHVILMSAYKGSYSNDYDDQHEQVRMCIICGHQEVGPIFTKLVRPMARFELSTPSLLNETPLGVRLFRTSMRDLLRFVRKEGCKVV